MGDRKENFKVASFMTLDFHKLLQHHKHSFYIILNSRLNGLTLRKLSHFAIAASHSDKHFNEIKSKYSSVLLPEDIEIHENFQSS